ncbi:hypothetical protein HK405_011504, partial [Cladochytrium tenue]
MPPPTAPAAAMRILAMALIGAGAPTFAAPAATLHPRAASLWFNIVQAAASTATCAAGSTWEQDSWGMYGCVNTSAGTCATGAAWSALTGECACLPATPVGSPAAGGAGCSACSSSTTTDVFGSLRAICANDADLAGGNCPYAVALDAITDLVGGFGAGSGGDGSTGLWGSGVFGWGSGLAAWVAADFFHAVGEGARSVDKFYFALRYGLEATYSATGLSNTNGNFLNDYLDDQGSGYTEAMNVYTNNLGYQSSTCSGGVLWKKDGTYKATISNLLTMHLALVLNNLTPDSNLVNEAVSLYQWLQSSGLVNTSTGEEKDGVTPGSTSSCTVSSGTYSYEYGVLLSFLVRLNHVTGDATYIQHAQTFARYAANYFTNPSPSGSCGCASGDGTYFSMAYFQGMAKYLRATKDATVAAYIRTLYLNMLA